MKVDLSKVNATLKSREKKNGQNATPIPNEVKELAKTKAKLEVEAGHLKRQLAKHGKEVKPAAASTAKPSPAKQRHASPPAVMQTRKPKHSLEQAAKLVPGWEKMGPQEKLAKLRELNQQ
jgi:hypothetical protein